MSSLIHNNRLVDVLFLIPASFQALMSYSLEERFNVKLFGYDLFVFLLLGFFPLLARAFSAKRLKIETTVFLLIILSFLASLRYIYDYYFAHVAIGIEFLLGYIFAKNISYERITILIIYYVTLIVFVLLAIQQISFSLDLGWFSTGQREIELIDGIYRVRIVK